MFEKQFPILLVSLVTVILITACSAPQNSTAPIASAAPTSLESVTPTSLPTTPAQMVAITPTSAAGTGTGVSTSTRVLWTINAYVMGPVSAVDETTAKTYLFKPLDIESDKIVFDGQTCQNVTFTSETVATDSYLADTWKTTQQALNINFPSLQVFKTNCDLPGFNEYMRLGDSRLIVPIEGVFYFFEPRVNK